MSRQRVSKVAYGRGAADTYKPPPKRWHVYMGPLDRHTPASHHAFFTEIAAKAFESLHRRRAPKRVILTFDDEEDQS